MIGIVLLFFIVSAIPQIMVYLPASSPLYTTNTSIELNFSIMENNLGSLIYNWNGTNFTFYNDSLVLMMNFNNVSALGENSIKAVDVSKYANNGTLKNGTIWNSSGKYGGSCSFNSANKNYIDLGSNNSIDLGDGSRAKSVSFWFYPKTLATGWNVIVAKDRHNSGYEGYIYVTNNGLCATNDGPCTGTGTVLANQWQQGTISWNATIVSIYLNGILKNRVAESAFKFYPDGNMIIGARNNNAGSCCTDYFNGSIDEVKIWNRSLSDTEVYQQYISNLNKFNSTDWNLYVNQSKNATARLDNGTYSYQTFAADVIGNLNSTESRTIIIGGAEDTAPLITFNYPTPENGTTQTGTSVYVNISSSDDHGGHYVVNNFDNSLLGWWRMDSVNSSIVFDSSGYSNNLTRTNIVINSSSGIFGNGSLFNGANGYLRDDTFSALASNITLSAWIKTSSSAKQFILQQNRNLGNYQNEYVFQISSGNLDFWDYGTSDYGFLGEENTSEIINDGGWHHVVFVKRGVLGEFYIDGVADGTKTALQDVVYGTSDLVIGRDNRDVTSYFDGAIDEVMIFNRSLSSQEIRALHNATANKYYNNFTELSQETHTFKGYAVDLFGEINSTELRTINIPSALPDTTYPIFSIYQDNNASLINSGTGLFNVTIENTNGTVILEINNINLTATHLIANIYNVSYDFLSNGTFSYRWHSWGNGTNENYNVSETRYYLVNYSCIPNIVNISWSEWRYHGACMINDLQLQNRSRIEYDANSCNEIENQTLYEYQNISCNYCSYNQTNTSWSEWVNVSCLPTNLMNQSRNKIEYDFNYNFCYALTGLDSDLWNFGENITYYEYKSEGSCQYLSVNVALNHPGNNYEIDSDDTANIFFNCSANYNSGLSNISLYLSDGENENFRLNQTIVASGLDYSANWTLELAAGNYTWNCLSYSEDGKSAFATSNQTILIGFVDSDDDGIRNNLDRLNGNKASVIEEGIDELNIAIGNETNLTSFNDTVEILFYDSEELIVNFTHNFSRSVFDLEEITINKSDNYILVNLSNQLQENYNKTLYINDNDFVFLCVEDSEIEFISNISNDCNEENEILMTSCLGENYSVNGIVCIDEGDVIKIENLRHSAILGIPASTPETPTQDTSRRRGSSSKVLSVENNCTSNWTCDSWSFCSNDFTQQRKCTNLNNCSIVYDKPEELRKCPDILFDSLVELDKNKIYRWSPLKFNVNLKEINQSDLVDVKIIYRITKNQKNVYEESETKAIEGEIFYSKEIRDLHLPSGEYSLQVVVDYGKNQSASSEKNFSIVGFESYGWILFAFFICGLLVFVTLNWHRARKREEEIEEKLEEIEEKLEEIESPRGFFVNIADKIEKFRLRSVAFRKERLLDSDDVLNEINRKSVKKIKIRDIKSPEKIVNEVLTKYKKSVTKNENLLTKIKEPTVKGLRLIKNTEEKILERLKNGIKITLEKISNDKQGEKLTSGQIEEIEEDIEESNKRNPEI